MANDNQNPAVSNAFWDRVEGKTASTSDAASSPASSQASPQSSSQPQTDGLSHSFWDRVEGKTPQTSSDVANIGGQPVNLKTGVGATQAASSQAASVVPPALDKTTTHTGQFTFPAAGPGAPLTTIKTTPEKAAQLEEEGRAARTDAGKQALVAGGAMVAPEFLPEMEGAGLLSYLGRLLTRSGAAGVGAGAGNMTGQAVTGQNPFTPENLAETGKVAGTTALVSVLFEALGGLAKTKLGRSAINQSVGAQTRDITYGNPAKALIDEDIAHVATGDFEAYKSALRAGKTPAEATQAAGGRFASVNQRINEYAPRLEQMLAQSTKTIPVVDAIDAPLHQAALDIINNRAMTDAEKDTAITQIGALQKSLKEGLGKNITPLELNRIKQQIGNRVNWGGNVSVTDEVKPAYRSLYGNFNRLINQAVPEAAGINERLSNLLSAASDLETLMKAEEVGRGGGLTAGKIGSTAVGVVKQEAGRVLPGASSAAKSARPVAAGAAAAGTLELSDDDPTVRIQFPDGTVLDLHSDDADEALRRNPGAKVIQ